MKLPSELRLNQRDGYIELRDKQTDRLSLLLNEDLDAEQRGEMKTLIKTISPIKVVQARRFANAVLLAHNASDDKYRRTGNTRPYTQKQFNALILGFYRKNVRPNLADVAMGWGVRGGE